MRILAVDHGGMRGIAAAQVLCVLEQQLGRPLYDCFDLFVGTSAGSIICGGLATGMSVEMIRDSFLTSRSSIFSRPQNLLSLMSRSNSAMYSSEGFEEVLKVQFGGIALNSSISKKLCIVSSTTSTSPASTFLFRNYEAPSRYPCLTDVPLWKAVRASSAAPLYFPPFEDASLTAPFPGTGQLVGSTFIDGAIGSKPSSIAVTEARALALPGEPITILSISPGTVPSRLHTKGTESAFSSLPALLSSFSPNVLHFKTVLSAIVDSATSTEESDFCIQDLVALQNGFTNSFTQQPFTPQPVNYFRLKPTLSQPFSLDEIRADKISGLLEDVKKYMNSSSVTSIVENLYLSLDHADCNSSNVSRVVENQPSPVLNNVCWDNNDID
ncbi:hypothetical protein RCL1_008634 [Eukaryota sp. TZLM3-RCL]